MTTGVETVTYSTPGYGVLSGASSSSAGRAQIDLPINGITVSDAAYGAVDDGLSGWFTASWTISQPNLTLLTSAISTTVTNNGSYNNGTVATVWFPGLVGQTGTTPSQEWVNKPIAVAGAGMNGGTLVAIVVGFYNDKNNGGNATLLLDRPAPTTFSAVAANVLCPCFTRTEDGSGYPTAVGKSIWINNSGDTSAGTSNIIMFTPISTTISAVVSPFTATLAVNITAATQTAQISRVVWGTDNKTAIVAAGTAAVNTNRRSLFFPGFTTPYSTGLYCIFNWLPNTTFGPTAAQYNATVAAGTVNWLTSGKEVRTFVCSDPGYNPGYPYMTDFEGPKITGIPWNAPAHPILSQTITGTVHLPRCNTLNTITCVVTGDSWGVPNPSGTGGNDHYSLLCAQIQRQNPGKTIRFINRAISAQTWYHLNGVASIKPSWYSPAGNTWLSFIQADNPDLVVIYMTGNNDANSGMWTHRNDIQSVINKIRAFTSVNGLPPDILMVAGTVKSAEAFNNNPEGGQWQHEHYCAFLRAFARAQGIGYLDFLDYSMLTVDGWSTGRNILRHVPPLASGTATASSPYVIPIQCRDWFAVIALGITYTGQLFWTTAGKLSITLSNKPDNRLWIQPDGSNNLNVCAVAWGMPVTTTCSITSGAAALTTSGQTSLAVSSTVLNGFAPSYVLGNASNSWVSGIVGSCIMAPGVLYSGNDFRTYGMAYTNGANVFGADGCGTASATTTLRYGGQMFMASDATAKADIIVAGAGATTHMLTGANSLVTKVNTYTDYQNVGLLANASNTLAASAQTVFLGSITVAPTYHQAVSAGNDAGTRPVLTIQVRDNHVRLGYLLGGTSLTDVRSALQKNEIVWWEGEVERFGGPYAPKIFADASVTVQVLDLWIGERDLYLPQATNREVWGGNDPQVSDKYGGDTSHYSQLGISRVVGDLMLAQSFATGTTYANNFGTNTPIAGFSYTIPANQSLTKFTPAGVLATGTVTLPSVFPQGGRLEIFSSQTITALTVSAPTGYTIDGTAATTISGGSTIAYRLNGTVFTRVL